MQEEVLIYLFCNLITIYNFFGANFHIMATKNKIYYELYKVIFWKKYTKVTTFWQKKVIVLYKL
jgi:hypothetical protein